MRSRLIGILLCCLLSQNGQPQGFYVEEKDLTKELILYNIGINSVMGGIGSLINKPKEEAWHKALLKGMGWGAVGGFIKYEAKILNRLIQKHDRPEYAWLSKTVYFAGSSIVENAAAHRGVLEQWHYNIGFIRFELNTEQGIKFRSKLMPASFVGFVRAIKESNGLHTKLSLRTGSFVFYAIDNKGSKRGSSFPGALWIRTRPNGELYDYSIETLAHEHIHQFQNWDYSSTNLVIDPWLKRKLPFYEKLNKYIYPEWGLIPKELIFLNNKNELDGLCKFNKFSEAEAEWHSSGKIFVCSQN